MTRLQMLFQKLAAGEVRVKQIEDYIYTDYCPRDFNIAETNCVEELCKDCWNEEVPDETDWLDYVE